MVRENVAVDELEEFIDELGGRGVVGSEDGGWGDLERHGRNSRNRLFRRLSVSSEKRWRVRDDVGEYSEAVAPLFYTCMSPGHR